MYGADSKKAMLVWFWLVLSLNNGLLLAFNVYLSAINIIYEYFNTCVLSGVDYHTDINRINEQSTCHMSWHMTGQRKHRNNSQSFMIKPFSFFNFLKLLPVFIFPLFWGMVRQLGIWIQVLVQVYFLIVKKTIILPPLKQNKYIWTNWPHSAKFLRIGHR